MPRSTTGVVISSNILNWAMESAGFSPDDVSRRLQVPVEEVKVWKRKATSIRFTVRQLEDLAHYFRRPTAALLLEKPPSQLVPPRDFRRPLQRATPFSPELSIAVRRARRLRQTARGILEAMGQPFTSGIPRASLDQDPEAIAKTQREALKITIEDQLRWGSPGEAYRHWRDALEAQRIPVFQADFPRNEAQGFSLSDKHPYAIVVTAKDPFTARCFTLFHELAHLILREGGICITSEVPRSDNTDELSLAEGWCHRFAEALLVDGEVLEQKEETHIVTKKGAGYEQALRKLALSFKVSQHVILFRLKHLDLVSEPRFWDEYARIQQEAAAEQALREHQQKSKKGGRQHPAVQTVQERGRLFTRIVLEGLERQVLNYSETIDYLGIRLKHLQVLRREAYRNIQ